ncbi:MAG: rhodanese-like domain-containing protein [Gemmatimonadetes bacterium]|nr:rhodanese-like domain-containing protein [Gemmatimonadota bacterium]MYH20000.1 rhodanese-like domain-containing protein [Gemmatimonadota bacterium]MYK99518.1 rhodanese-like domain-containing protein [Gemmatimonadota bacterium]
MKDQIAHYENKLKYETDSYDLWESITLGKDVVVVDARSEEAYAERHIPGAVNIPHRTMDPETTGHLDKNSLYVTYCDGIGCNASTKGALNMARLGFNVKELMGGLDWWIRDGYETEGLQATEGKALVCGCG